jgi:putative phosphoesterase
MRYGIFSDVHSNLEAFEVTIDYYKKEKIDRFIFLGDIVGYGADPSKTVALLKTLKPIVVAGNHDWAVIDKFSVKNFNRYAKEAILWTRENLRQEDITYLHTFKIIYEGDDFLCVHSNVKKPGNFHYIWNIDDARENFPLLKKRVCFIGHSHKMETYYLDDGKMFYLREYEIKLKSQGKYIINVGSVGQPRDRDSRLSLCVYDSSENMVSFKRLEYNIEKAADKILSKGLPSILALRLYGGW